MIFFFWTEQMLIRSVYYAIIWEYDHDMAVVIEYIELYCNFFSKKSNFRESVIRLSNERFIS